MRRTPICDYMDIPILLLTTHPYVCYTQIMRFSYSCMDRAFLIHFYLLAVQIQLQLLLAFMTLSIFNLSHSHRQHMILLINPKIYVYMYICQTLVFYLYGGKQKLFLPYSLIACCVKQKRKKKLAAGSNKQSLRAQTSPI